MESRKVFKITLSVSILAHGVIFLGSPNFGVVSVSKDAPKIEVKYIHSERPVARISQKAAARGEPLLKLPARIIADNRMPPPYRNANVALEMPKPGPLASRGQLFRAPALSARPASGVQNKISLSSPDANISKNPAYIGYYQFSREKIQRTAYQQNYSGGEEGEVTVSFIIASDGSLCQVRLVEDQSCSSQYLRDLAVESVKEAAPFPKFPRSLDYPQIPFTLTITFQN